MDYYTQIISAYYTHHTNCHFILNLIRALRKYLTITEIDDRITRYTINNCARYTEEMIIDCYTMKLYKVIYFLVKQGKYMRFTEKIYCECNHNCCDCYTILIQNARIINPAFKASPEIIIYIDINKLSLLLESGSFDINELKEWHRAKYWYYYNIDIITKYINIYVWENSLRCAWINACIFIEPEII